MSNTVTLSLNIRNIVAVNGQRQLRWMGIESIPFQEALSYVDTLVVSYHSIIRILVPPLQSMEGKRYTSCRSYSMNVYKPNH